MSKSITIRSGDVIKHNNINFVFLGMVDGNLLCVARKSIGSFPFDDISSRPGSGMSNFYPESTIRNEVDRFAGMLDNRILVPMTMEVSPFRSESKKYFTDICGLLSAEQCAKYQEFLPRWHDHMWTLTPFRSAERSANSAAMVWARWRDLNFDYSCCRHGVAPACIFASKHLKLRREAQGIIVEYDDSQEVSE